MYIHSASCFFTFFSVNILAQSGKQFIDKQTIFDLFFLSKIEIFKMNKSLIIIIYYTTEPTYKSITSGTLPNMRKRSYYNKYSEYMDTDNSSTSQYNKYSERNKIQNKKIYI